MHLEAVSRKRRPDRLPLGAAVVRLVVAPTLGLGRPWTSRPVSYPADQADLSRLSRQPNAAPPAVGSWHRGHEPVSRSLAPSGPNIFIRCTEVAPGDTGVPDVVSVPISAPDWPEFYPA